MSPEQIEEARRAVERVRDDLGEHKVRAGRDHEVLEAARWAAALLREIEERPALVDVLRRFFADELTFSEIQNLPVGRPELVLDGSVALQPSELATVQAAIDRG